MTARQDERVLAIRGTALFDRRLVADTVVVVRGGVIERVGPARGVVVPRDAEWIENDDATLAPGFLDIHIHGSGGHRIEDDPLAVARHVVRNGTTFFLPTMLSNELDAMVEAAQRIAACAGPVRGGAVIGGIHLEGPFLNPRYGAQMSRHNIEPNPAAVAKLIAACGKHLRLVAVAPERRGAADAIRTFRAAGAVVSIGHSDANEEEYRLGRAAGVTHATHIFCAMPPRQWPTAQTFDGRKPVGIEELILADEGVSADIVCDATCAHVHASLLKIALRCKGIEKLSLITDAMPAAGRPPGEFKLADGQSIFTSPTEDVARLANGLLCGSVMSMCGALRNWIAHTGSPLEQALVMVSEAPARAIGVFDRKGSIAAGKDADLVWLNREHQVVRTMIRGQVEYEADKVAV